MESQYTQNKFSQLYNSHNDKLTLLESEIDVVAHPFELIIDYFNSNSLISYLKDFKNGVQLITVGNEIKKRCYICFEFELGMLSANKNAYLNEIVEILLKSLQKINTTHGKSFIDIPALRILYNTIRKVLQDIFITYHLDLNQRNRTILSKWYYLKTPIQSFSLKKQINPKRLNILFYQHFVHNRLISSQTEFETFQTLFQAKHLENKINWTGDKSTLYYFIRLLVNSKLIKNPNNTHWSIASEFFLLKGELLTPKDFLNQKETQNNKKRVNLENFIEELKS